MSVGHLHSPVPGIQKNSGWPHLYKEWKVREEEGKGKRGTGTRGMCDGRGWGAEGEARRKAEER